MNIKGEEKDVLTRTLCEKVLDSYQKFSIQLVNTKQVKNGDGWYKTNSRRISHG